MTETDEIIEQLNSLVEELESYPDAEMREKTLDLIQLILSLHGEVLERILKTLEQQSVQDEVFTKLLEDDLIRSVLLVHGLMPEELAARVAATLEELRPFFTSQGCQIELLEVVKGRARFRVTRNGETAPPVGILRQELETALAETAPDLLEIEIEDVTKQIENTAKAADFLNSLVSRPNHESPKNLVQIKRTPMAKNGAKWLSAIRSFGFKEGQFEIVNYDDINLLITKIGGEFYAFRNACAESGEPFDSKNFENPTLRCDCHNYRYDLSKRGVCDENPELKLESLPVKVEEDKVKVAL